MSSNFKIRQLYEHDNSNSNNHIYPKVLLDCIVDDSGKQVLSSDKLAELLSLTNLTGVLYLGGKDKEGQQQVFDGDLRFSGDGKISFQASDGTVKSIFVDGELNENLIQNSSENAKGLMTSDQFNKLNGIAARAEVNQNAFSSIVTNADKDSNYTNSADSKTASFTINKKTATAAQGNYITLKNTAKNTLEVGTNIPAATTSAQGLMSASDKTKLDSFTATTSPDGNLKTASFNNAITVQEKYEAEDTAKTTPIVKVNDVVLLTSSVNDFVSGDFPIVLNGNTTTAPSTSSVEITKEKIIEVLGYTPVEGIQNNLESESTTQALAAAQGKVLKTQLDEKVSLTGGTMTGQLKNTESIVVGAESENHSVLGSTYINSLNGEGKNGDFAIVGNYVSVISTSTSINSPLRVSGQLTASSANISGTVTASRVSASILQGTVQNDYAEYRESDILEPGRVVKENGDDTLSLTTERLAAGANIISDTFGFTMGETDKAKTPIAVAGRVLAYTLEDRELYRKNIGKPVCSGPNGTVSIMTEEEEMRYPSRIIGTVSAVPDYETWGEKNVSVNGRVWIRVK